MNQLQNVREHQEVIGSDGGHVGTVDHVDGSRLKLTRKDSADGQHHFLEGTYVRTVGDKVHLSVSADEAQSALTTS